MSSAEFVKWKVRLHDEPNDFNPDHQYYALIAAEITRSYVKNPERVKLKDKILNFVMGTRKRSNPTEVESATNLADRVAKSKAAWGAGFGKKWDQVKGRWVSLKIGGGTAKPRPKPKRPGIG